VLVVPPPSNYAAILEFKPSPSLSIKVGLIFDILQLLHTSQESFRWRSL